MFKKLLAVAALPLAIAGCDSSSGGSGGGSGGLSVVQVTGGGCPTIAGTGNAGSMEGIYDITDYRRSPTNVMYTVVTSDGGATDFDYQADSVGNGGNCFVKSQEGFASITHVNGERYLWTFADPFVETSGCAYASDEVFVRREGDFVSIALNGGASVKWRKVDVRVGDLIPCQ